MQIQDQGRAWILNNIKNKYNFGLDIKFCQLSEMMSGHRRNCPEIRFFHRVTHNVVWYGSTVLYRVVLYRTIECGTVYNGKI